MCQNPFAGVNIQHKTLTETKMVKKTCRTSEMNIEMANLSFEIWFFFQQSMCSRYGPDGKGTKGYDCVVIPRAAKMTTAYPLLPFDAFCGQGGLVTTKSQSAKTVGKTVCCKWLGDKQFALLFIFN